MGWINPNYRGIYTGFRKAIRIELPSSSIPEDKRKQIFSEIEREFKEWEDDSLAEHRLPDKE